MGGQGWWMSNLTKRQQKYGAKLGEILFEGNGEELLLFLRKVAHRPLDECIKPYIPGAHVMLDQWGRGVRLAQRSSVAPTGIVALPVELLDAIFETIHGVVERLMLGMTCQTLWAVARRHVYTLFVQQAAETCNWAGDRIACLGDYMLLREAPDHILSEEERAEMRRGRPTGADNSDSDEEDGGDRGPIPDWWWTECGQRSWVHRTAGAVHNTVLRHAKYQGDAMWVCDGLLDVAITCDPPLAPRTAVLRNLTLQVYVREAALVEMCERFRGSDELRAEFDPHGPGLKLWDTTLGDLLHCRICWSSVDSTAMLYDGNICQGVWAGHCFDIVGGEWLGKEEQTEGWTDVSDEALAELEAIWRSEFRPRGY
ncbi:hypothetical protein MIND_00988100 [Mycena indigotica]|uniref:F-box domain-containing protein n=1 Tax=Mycena indigotica TaxID=2126181 RepID=A0A8H6VXC4_9AGAR|nr:uncharacterized protein MIND_00988100 [Mycena indigotica]KAF7297539.1 hypothetical protein MIND_00988100 [Mycena indigotica]